MPYVADMAVLRDTAGCDGWDGWKYRKGCLITPHNEVFTVKHLEMLPILNQWRNEQEAEIKKEKLKASNKIKDMKFYR